MTTKISALRDAWARGDRLAALRIAARFPRLGDDKAAITRGHDALVHPDFHRQLGRDPDALVSDALESLRRRYSL